eukprot:scaffold21273_cov61-Phaeocystis_antarctica.AAC.6
MDYVSDNFGEMPMSSVRCSMEVLSDSVRLFCPRSVSGTGYSCTVPRLRKVRPLWFRMMKI